MVLVTGIIFDPVTTRSLIGRGSYRASLLNPVQKCFAYMLNLAVDTVQYKAKVIRANLMHFDFDLYFEDIFRFCDISSLITFQFWLHCSFGDISFW